MTSPALSAQSQRPTEQPTWLEAHWKALVKAEIAFLPFVALFIFVSATGSPTAAKAESAGAMLAIITAAAVGIERALETFWSMVGQLANGWWPFNEMYAQVASLENDLKVRLAAVQEAIRSALDQANAAAQAAPESLKRARDEMEVLQQRLKELDGLAPGNQRVSLIAATVTQAIGMVEQYQPQIDYNLRLIDQSLAGLTDFVASFKENPARRLINIWAGAMIGMVLAYFVRMDVFYAVLGTAPAGPWPNLGVALTGLIVGLGSNPTHDVIAALQEIKKYRASQNQPGPITVDVSAEEGGVLRTGVPGAFMGLNAPPSAAPVPRSAGEGAPAGGRPAPGGGAARNPAPPLIRRFR